MAETPTITFRLGDHDREILDALARIFGVNRGQVVRFAIRSLDERVRAGSYGGVAGVLEDNERSLDRAVA